MKTAQEMLRQFQAKRSAQPRPVPDGGFLDAEVPPAEGHDRPLQTWPALPRYLVEELVRADIDKTTAIRIVRRAWIRATAPQEAPTHG